MKCPSKKDLYLYYYRDIDEKKMLSMKQHFQDCMECSQEYAKIIDFLSGLKKEEVSISEGELFSMVDRVKSRISGRIKAKERLEEKMKSFMEGLKRRFIYRPSYAIVTIIIFVIVVSVPIKNEIVFKEAMMDMELDLVLDLDAFEEDILLDFYNS